MKHTYLSLLYCSSEDRLELSVDDSKECIFLEDSLEDIMLKVSPENLCKNQPIEFFSWIPKIKCLPDEYCCVEGARIKNENWGGVVELWSDSWVGGGDLKERKWFNLILNDKSFKLMKGHHIIIKIFYILPFSENTKGRTFRFSFWRNFFRTGSGANSWTLRFYFC